MEQTPYINFDNQLSPSTDDGWTSADYMVYRMDIVTPYNINFLIQHLEHLAIVEHNNLDSCSKQPPPQIEEIIPQSSKKNGDKKEKKKKKKSKKGVQNKKYVRHRRKYRKFVPKLEPIPEENFY